MTGYGKLYVHRYLPTPDGKVSRHLLSLRPAPHARLPDRHFGRNNTAHLACAEKPSEVYADGEIAQPDGELPAVLKEQIEQDLIDHEWYDGESELQDGARQAIIKRYYARRPRSERLVVTRFSSGATMTRNARGLCEDAPACGCCTF